MLSINIPVYNVEITDLVLQLSEQAQKLNTEYEIRIYDDGSETEVRTRNSKVAAIPNVVYREMGKNIGRAAIRNRMGFDSKFRYLLFIDADSKLVSNNYLAYYLRYAETGNIICGGTVYHSEQPHDSEKILRWHYGTHREAISAQQKNRKKGFIITSNNFLIPKEIFQQIHFREDIKKYGHEDTMLGFDLFIKGFKIVHFDNPVEHTGLENAAAFIIKTKMAAGNLWFISEHLNSDKKEFMRQVAFLNRYRKITRIVPEFFLRLLYEKLAKPMEKNLTGTNPNLLLFDFYRLSYFATIKNRGEKNPPR